MRSDVLTGDVGDETLISILFGVEDKRTLSLLFGTAIAFRPDKQPQFERHVEARQRWIAVGLGARKIVNTEPALLDDILDFREPVFRRILGLQRASGSKTRTSYRESDRVENRRELLVESAVDENVSRKRSRHLLPLERSLWGLSKSAGFRVLVELGAQLLSDGCYSPSYFLGSEMRRRHRRLQDSYTVIRPAD